MRCTGRRLGSRAEVKAWLNSVRDAPTPEAGREAAAEMIARFEGQYPAAIKSFADDLEASRAHLRLPVAHRKYARTTNLIERSFVEERRRTKVIPHFFTERSCLKLAFAALDRASRRWQRVTITELEQRQLEMLRKDLEPDLPPETKRTDTLAA